MKSIPVGELKAGFSAILEEVRKGEKVVISYGKKKEKVAVILPFKEDQPRRPRKLGLLKGKSKCIIKGGFRIGDEELLSS